MTDKEIDFLLERFDKTEPRLQRRIIARFIEDRENLLIACKAMRATMYSPNSEESKLADAAIAKAEGTT